MSLIVSHNLSAMQTTRNLGINNNSMTKSIEKLSSGYKINVGADDPSGLIISEQLRSQISGLQRAVRNSSEAHNLIGIAEGALNEMNELLKKMRALAIHAANSGVTSPEQTAADQSEMDSGIQTLERIANTTRYSDQYLLNGSKQLVYDVSTVVNDTGDHQLLNTEMTRVDQIFKRDGVKMSISFTGEKDEWQANTKTSAQRAFLEADPYRSTSQVTNAKLTAPQEFILTGTKGSRLFSFAEGTDIGTVVSGINNVKDSTGISASMIFASDVRIDVTGFGTIKVGGAYSDTDYSTGSTQLAGDLKIPGYNKASPETYIYKAGEVQIYGADLNNPAQAKIACFSITPDAAASFRVGYNCDGDGKIYAKVVDKSKNTIEYYKDADCTMLIGKGSGDFFSSTNNSNIPSYPQYYLDGIFLQLDQDNAQDKDVYAIAVVGQEMNNMKDFDVHGVSGWSDIGNSVMSGVNLGVNTSSEGQLFFKYVPVTFDPASNEVVSFRIEAFKNSRMEPRDLVATSGEVLANVIAAGGYDDRMGQTVRLESVLMDDGHPSNLNITLNIPLPGHETEPLPDGEQTGDIVFTNLGLRVYATDYGTQETIRIQNKTGDLFYYYRTSDSMEKIMIKPETTVQLAGQDALIGVNGAPVITTGLVANTTTPDFVGSLVFNGGTLGLATMAVTGHEAGSLYSAAGYLQGIKEDERVIVRDERYFIPASILYNDLTVAGSDLGIKDVKNSPVGLYLDFTNLDPSVKQLIQNLGPANTGAITVTYTAATPPAAADTATLTIDAGGLGITNTVDIRINNANLTNGFYITDPALKGLYIKTLGTIDPGMTEDSLNTSPLSNGNLEITPYAGNNVSEVHTYATNPRTNTTENMSDFKGGMQFQLGNTEGDQDRTVYSIQSMVMANVGRMEYNGVQYCLQNVLGGGVASLVRDPIMAMRILAQAADDVSTLRARLGAFQKNMLETNINALNVAVENITKTESAIRDTDMASESTEFTKNQIMVSAGTSMLSQANQVTQNVLTLLRA
ncbi:MAG: hypothetical protein LBU79_05470 [Planctomycetota bacterium]|jgi:flagellin-like hook-associated protein FlgL|nr:hypothetical protein [Planctomycetota bacterium]